MFSSAAAPAVFRPTDVALLCLNQSLAHRVQALWEAAPHAFPSGFATEALEVGPHRGHSGPRLVLFKGCTLNSQQVFVWLDGSYVRRYCQRLFLLDDTPAAATKEGMLARLISAGPPAGAGAVRIQANSKKLDIEVANVLMDAGWTLHPVAFQLVLTVVQLEGSWRWSMAPADCFFRFPCNEPSIHADSVGTAVHKLEEALHFSGVAQQLAIPLTQQPRCHQQYVEQQQHQQQQQQQVQASIQAQQQLQQQAERQQQEHQQQQQLDPRQQQWLERRQQQRLQLQQQRQQQQRQQQQGQQQQGQQPGLQWALDVGASPGAWTAYLAARCQHVIAVDPAKMAQEALLSNVTHLQLAAADAVPVVRQLLGSDTLDLLVCDMNWNDKPAYEIIQPLLQFLRPGGYLILTLKFTGQGREKLTIEGKLNTLLQEELQLGRTLWLPANTQFERTYIAQRK